MTVQAETRYEANLALLGQKMPEMVTQIRQFPLTNVQLMPTPHGDMYGNAWSVTLQQWVPLCDGADPIGEAERDCEAMYSPNIKVFSLLGMGLGYFTAALAKRLRPYQRLVVFDLDPNLYKASLYAADFTPILTEGKRIDFVIGNDAIQQAEGWWLSLEAMEKLHIAGPMRAGYTGHCFKEQYDGLLQKTIDMIRIHAVGLSTWRTFGSAIGDNDLLNMPEYFVNPGYEHLAGLWQGKPAVCIAAGPSLQKNLHWLLRPELRSKVLVIAVGTVYAMLRRMGIEPDIVTTIDFQRLNWTDQFQHVPLDDAPALVYLHSTYPQTIRRWPGPRFVAENASDTVSWFKKFGEGKKGAGQVQTVAHLNLLVAATMGANPILLLGQDLSMPLTEHHAAGARAQDLAPSEAPEDAFVTATGYDGQPVQTRHSFLSMKTVFERIAIEHPASTFVNCTEGGLALEGIVNHPLGPLLQAFPALPQDPKHPDAVAGARRRIEQVYRNYAACIPDAALAGVATLREDVQAILDAGAAAETALAVGSLDDEATRQQILAQEAVIQARNAAFGLFAIRHFGILELLSEIPPLEETMIDTAAKEQYNCQRILRVVAMVREEAATVQRLLRLTAARLQTLARLYTKEQVDLPLVLRAMTHQHYQAALFQLWQVSQLDDPVCSLALLDQVRGRIAYHRQQYAVARALGLSPSHEARVAQRQWQYAGETGRHLGSYFSMGVGQDDDVVPAPLPLGGEASCIAHDALTVLPCLATEGVL